MLPIDDWGGFERLVAALHETGSVTVQHNTVLKDSHGISRQIDVLITHTTAMYRHQVIAECKYWNKRVPRAIVDALATSVRELNASKGVVFSTVGFQKGALQAAKALGVDLFKVRALKNDEWLIPGKVIPIYIQAFSRGIDGISVTGIEAIGGAKLPSQLSFPFSSPPREFLRPQSNPPAGYPALSIIELVEAFSLKAVIGDIAKRGIIFDCPQNQSVFLRGQAQLLPPTPVLIPLSKGRLKVSRVEMGLGIKVRQSQAFEFDQSTFYDFVLAVDDCVNQQTQIAWRNLGEAMTRYEHRDREVLPDNHILRSGIVFQYFQKQLFDFQTESAPFGPEAISHPRLFQVFPASDLPDTKWCELSNGWLTQQ